MNQTNKLVRLARKGDVHAFARLYEFIYKDLYRFALYTLQNPQDAEDAVSETVMDAFAQIASLREPEAFNSWMFRILTAKCNHKIRDYVKKEMALPEDLPDSGQDLPTQMDIRRAFETLPEEDRLILSMNLFAGYSSQEIGEQLNMNPNTVRSRQSRALKKLEALLS